jgi:broad specificity phosphatase PhoE
MSSPIQIYLVRHGETEWSATGQHTGTTDKPLTEAGRQQAESIRTILRKVSFSLVLSSPLSRAVETAQIAGLGSRVETREELREFSYGDYEGLTTQEIREKVPEWTVWTHPCPGGETLEAAAERAKKLLEEVNGTAGSIVIFSHGHMLRILACVYLGIPPENGRHLELSTCSVSILGTEHGTPTIKLWNSLDTYYSL